MRVLLLALAWSGVSAAGDVYKWTDATGAIHFGDQPPNLEAERVETGEALRPSDTPPGLRPDERRLLERVRRAEQERLRARQAEARARERNVARKKKRNAYCVRLGSAIDRYEDERAEGCTARRCARIDQQIARYQRLTRERCRP